ncbi:MAG: sodium-dependent bicarbonate transport family permease [Pseudomonadota bacterium]
MDTLSDLAGMLLTQLQKPTLAFLIGGMVLAALGSRLVVPEAIYKFIVTLLLLKVGLGAGMSVRESNPAELAIPALAAAGLGVLIVLLGAATLARRRGVAWVDGVATAGLFGAVSASTLAAGMAMLDAEGIAYEGFIGALYPFMDLAALLTAIVLARMSAERRAVLHQNGTATMGGPSFPSVDIRAILIDTARSPAISALLLGLAIGFLSKPEALYESFYQQLFYGLLSILMLIMGMEAWERLSEMRKVAHTYLAYGLLAPLVHGLLGLGAGVLVHQITGFSEGGVVLLAVLAASSSDISGPPTLRGALPEANPSAYIGTSTGLGTPVAILAIPLWMVLADRLVS